MVTVEEVDSRKDHTCDPFLERLGFRLAGLEDERVEARLVYVGHVGSNPASLRISEGLLFVSVEARKPAGCALGCVHVESVADVHGYEPRLVVNDDSAEVHAGGECENRGPPHIKVYPFRPALHPSRA